jgi:hypothetical protein
LRQQLVDQQVGGVALADPTRVEADARRQGDRLAGAVDDDPVVASAEP